MHDVPRRAVIGAVGLVATVGPHVALAVEAPLALKGYDPVSYFTKGRPEKGLAEFAASFDGAMYWFGSGEHRALFVADPDRYAPQFRGWCAMSLTRGEIVESDPESWAIADGKLYVFGKPIGPRLFVERRASNIEAATKNWRELRKDQ